MSGKLKNLNILEEILKLLTKGNQILVETGLPDPGQGNQGDLYIQTDSVYDNTGDLAYRFFRKTTSLTWVEQTELKAPTVSINWSSDNINWHETYVANDIYIRFSNDDENNWTTGTRIIGFFTYYAYASDISGSDFICDANAGFVFDSSLEFIAQKSFVSPQSSLLVSDFTGLFTRYKGEGIAFSVIPGSILIPKDQDKIYDYTNANSQIIIRQEGVDLTTSFTYIKGAESNVTATVGLNTGLVTITNITSSNGYVDVVCSKSGTTDRTLRIYVKEILDGVDGITGLAVPNNINIPTDGNGNNPLFTNSESSIVIYRGQVDVTSEYSFSKSATSNADGTLLSNIFTFTSISADTGYVEIECSKSGVDTLTIRIYAKKSKAGQAIIDATSIDNETIYLRESSWNTFGSPLSITVSASGYTTMTSMSITRIAFIDRTNDLLKAYDFDGTIWKQVGEGLVITGNDYAGITALNSTTIAYISTDGSPSAHDLTTYIFNGKVWEQVGIPLSLSSALGRPKLTTMSSTRIAYFDTADGDITAYDWDGSTWSPVGSSLILAAAVTATITSLTSTTIAYLDNTGYIKIYTFNGSTWSLTNTSSQISSVGNVSIMALSSTEIAMIDDSNGELRKYIFSGVDWAESVGSVSISGVTNPVLAGMSEYSVAYFDTNNEDLLLYYYGDDKIELKLSGTGGERLKKDICDNVTTKLENNEIKLSGNTIFHKISESTITSSLQPSITDLTLDTVAYYDKTNAELRTYKINGSTWSLEGSGLSIPGLDRVYLSNLTPTDIALLEYNFSTSVGTLSTYRWNGSVWVKIGNSLAFATISLAAMSKLTSTTVVISNAYVSPTVVQSYSFNGIDWSSSGNSFTVGANAIASMGRLTDTTIVLTKQNGGDNIANYEFDGTDWTISSDITYLDSSITFPLVATSSEYVMYYTDSNNSVIRSYYFNGEVWEKHGFEYTIPGSIFRSICVLPDGKIAFIDDTDNNLISLVRLQIF